MEETSLCLCGHEYGAHAIYFGMACKFCKDCIGYEEFIECICSINDLWKSGCQCGAIDDELKSN